MWVALPRALTLLQPRPSQHRATRTSLAPASLPATCHSFRLIICVHTLARRIRPPIAGTIHPSSLSVKHLLREAYRTLCTIVARSMISCEFYTAYDSHPGCNGRLRDFRVDLSILGTALCKRRTALTPRKAAIPRGESPESNKSLCAFFKCSECQVSKSRLLYAWRGLRAASERKSWRRHRLSSPLPN